LLLGLPVGLIALERLARHLEQLPVQVILGFGLDEALAGDELGRFRRT
jgi:hypothetical protein